jgi:nucleoside-diphosphate-sugar epimerase
LYAENKVAIEQRLLDSPTTKPQVTVLRFATLFGLSPRMRFDLTVNEFTMELATARRLTVFGQQFWRPYVHVRDAARAILAALEAPAADVSNQVFNVGDTSQNFQKGSLVRMIAAEVGDPLDIEYVVNKNDDPRDYRVSFDKINRVLGYEITRAVVDGIREVKQATLQNVFGDTSQPQYRN